MPAPPGIFGSIHARSNILWNPIYYVNLYVAAYRHRATQLKVVQDAHFAAETREAAYRHRATQLQMVQSGHRGAESPL